MSSRTDQVRADQGGERLGADGVTVEACTRVRQQMVILGSLKPVQCFPEILGRLPSVQDS